MGVLNIFGVMDRPFRNMMKILDSLYQESTLTYKCNSAQFPRHPSTLKFLWADPGEPPWPSQGLFPQHTHTHRHTPKPCFWELLRNKEEKSRDRKKEKLERASEEQEAEGAKGSTAVASDMHPGMRGQGGWRTEKASEMLEPFTK